MKYLASFLIVFFLIHTVNVYGADCTDPGGCSMVSYTFASHTVGLIQFGNTTGKIFLRKTKDLCQPCFSTFILATALTAPASGSSTLHAADLRKTSLMINVLERSTQTILQKIGITEFLNNKNFLKVSSQAKISFDLVLFQAAGDNGILSHAKAGSQEKIVHQILKSPRLVSPTTLQVTNDLLLSATVDRDLTLVASFEFTPDNKIQTTLQPVKGRKKNGVADVFLKSRDPRAAEFVHSPDITPQLRDVPVLGHLLASKTFKISDKDRIQIFVTPVIITAGEQERQANRFRLGKPVAVTGVNITKNRGIDAFQSVAIDPLGRFLLYSEFNSGCNKHILKYQRLNPKGALGLNATGIKIGRPKVLAGCSDLTNSFLGAYGLDVINIE